MNQQISGRAGMLVSGLAAPASGQSNNVHAALGHKFNNRNSSGLLYMHHSSLNNIAQSVHGTASNVVGAASQNGPLH